MKRTAEINFVCELCGEFSDGLPVGGLSDEVSTTVPIHACPHCGAIDWELMQLCSEMVLGSNLN